MAKTYRNHVDGSDLLGRDLTPTEVDANFRDSDAREQAAIDAADNAIPRVFTAASDAAMIALSARKGDVCKRTDGADPKKVYQLNDADPTILSNWVYVGLYTLPSNLEITDNKSADLSSYDNIHYPSTKAVQDAITSAITGMYDLQQGYDASGNTFPIAANTNPVVATIKKGYSWNITVAGTLGGINVKIGDTLVALVDNPGTTAANWSIAAFEVGSTDGLTEGSTNKYFTAARVLATVLSGLSTATNAVVTSADSVLSGIGKLQKQLSDLISAKDASGGYAGLTSLKINFKNVANSFTSFLTNTNTAARTYTFQDRNGTIADDTDLSAKQDAAATTSWQKFALTQSNGKLLNASISDFHAGSAIVVGEYEIPNISLVTNRPTGEDSSVGCFLKVSVGQTGNIYQEVITAQGHKYFGGYTLSSTTWSTW